MKEPKCKICGGRHYAFQCWQKPNKPIKKQSHIKPYKPPVKKKVSKLSTSSTNDRKNAVKRLDRLFSEYARRFYCDKKGFGYCYTCGKRLYWKDFDIGHFIKRGKFNTRWDLENCRLQCKICNRLLSGNYEIYERKLKSEIGEKRLQELYDKANSNKKITTPEIHDMIEETKAKLKELPLK